MGSRAPRSTVSRLTWSVGVTSTRTAVEGSRAGSGFSRDPEDWPHRIDSDPRRAPQSIRPTLVLSRRGSSIAQNIVVGGVNCIVSAKLCLDGYPSWCRLTIAVEIEL
jgi:hypothetical protein